MPPSASEQKIYDEVVVQPKFWFWVALCALWPLQIWFVATDPWFRQPPKPIGDGPDYENIAYHLWQGHGWSMDWTSPGWQAPYLNASVPSSLPGEETTVRSGQPIADYTVQLSRSDDLSATTARPPLFPLLIAVVYGVFSRGPLAFAVVRLGLASCIALAGAISVALAVRIVWRLTNLTWPVALTAMLTMALAALDRTVRSYATDFLTEPLALLLVQILLWSCSILILPPRSGRQSVEPSSSATLQSLAGLQVWPAHWQTAGWLALAGTALGLLVLTRSIIVLWLPGVWLMYMAAMVVRHLRHSRQQFGEGVGHSLMEDLRRATLMVGVALLICAPWWLRNCVVLQTFMPLGTQGPISLLGGYHDQARQQGGQWSVQPELQLRQTIGQQLPDESILEREVRVARAASGQINQWINDHWGQLPILAWVRVKTEWNPYRGRALALRLAALIGLCWLLILHRSAAFLLGGLILVNTITVMVLYSVGGRFLVPNYGIIYSFAAIGVACTLARRHLNTVD